MLSPTGTILSRPEGPRPEGLYLVYIFIWFRSHWSEFPPRSIPAWIFIWPRCPISPCFHLAQLALVWIPTRLDLILPSRFPACVGFPLTHILLAQILSWPYSGICMHCTTSSAEWSITRLIGLFDSIEVGVVCTRWLVRRVSGCTCPSCVSVAFPVRKCCSCCCLSCSCCIRCCCNSDCNIIFFRRI